ncbi:MAG: serine protein kinase PrkA, partial [Lentisphaerae bacterium]
IRMPYILDYNTEVQIYRHFVQHDIDQYFLPHVLNDFARVIIATRMNHESAGMKQWIPDSKAYRKICDENLLLLKMDIYTGYIPPWVLPADIKSFDAQKRRRIIDEGEIEGEHGISGRQSIQLFYDFFQRYRSQKPIRIEHLLNFFRHIPEAMRNLLPKNFLNALRNHYEYTILQEVKEALYDYNQERIDADIKNYLFALSFEPGTRVFNPYTQEEIEVSEQFYRAVEVYCCPSVNNDKEREKFRRDTQKQFLASKLALGKHRLANRFTELDLYKTFFQRYTNRLKEHVLDPLAENETFRMAIKEYGTKNFSTYDNRIQQDVNLLFLNLQDKFGYTIEGAQLICIHILDHDIIKKFS